MNDESTKKTSRDPYRDLCRDVFKNIPGDTSKYSYEVPQKAFKNIELTSVTHNRMFKLTKENEKLEKNIIDLKDYVECLENSNKILCEEISSIIS